MANRKDDFAGKAFQLSFSGFCKPHKMKVVMFAILWLQG